MLKPTSLFRFWKRTEPRLPEVVVRNLAYRAKQDEWLRVAAKRAEDELRQGGQLENELASRVRARRRARELNRYFAREGR